MTIILKELRGLLLFIGIQYMYYHSLVDIVSFIMHKQRNDCRKRLAYGKSHEIRLKRKGNKYNPTDIQIL
jgi:hypothetical protein